MMTFSHYLTVLWFYISLWPVDVTLILIGMMTGILLPVRASAWFNAGMLFLGWGLLFQCALFAGFLWTPYHTADSYAIHMALMYYRLPFALGMVLGIVATGRHGANGVKRP